MNLTHVALFMFLTLLVCSVTFQTGCVLALNCDLREERLWWSLHIVTQCEKGIVLVLSQMYFHLHAYAVQRTNEYKVINLSNAADLKPLHVIS